MTNRRPHWKTLIPRAVHFQPKFWSCGSISPLLISIQYLWCRVPRYLCDINILYWDALWPTDIFSYRPYNSQWRECYFLATGTISNCYICNEILHCQMTHSVLLIYTFVLNLALTSDHVWLDWKSDHELSAEVLVVRDKERATKRWLTSDEVRWLKMEWRERKERIVVRWRGLGSADSFVKMRKWLDGER